MMPGDDLIQACLEELRGAEGMGALVRLVGDRAAVLLGDAGRRFGSRGRRTAERRPGSGPPAEIAPGADRRSRKGPGRTRTSRRAFPRRGGRND